MPCSDVGDGGEVTGSGTWPFDVAHGELLCVGEHYDSKL